ncbi:CLUMA_CG007557, isoform A [Clunio marinus]|uniref:TBC1 domain family member 15 n=1 Tax=Clunio marinus TaxID=568069 RepID=A0A1J1I6J6_9DIPT|nr:CLUMA_CG007557, isoform A [Clunio marinus]
MNSSWIEETHGDALELDADEEIFNQFDVILTRVPASHINEINEVGVIFIFKKQQSYFIEWKPNENVEIAGAEIAEDAIDEWSIINQITFKPAADSISILSPKLKNLRIPLPDIQQLKVQGPELKLYNRNDQHLVTYNFKRSTPASFIRVLQNFRLLKPSVHDRNCYLIKDPEFEKLQRSFAELNIEEIKTAKSPPRPFYAHGYELLSQIGKNVLGNRNDRISHQNRPGAYRFEMGSDTLSSNDTSPEMDNKTEVVDNNVIEERLPLRQIKKRDSPLSLKQWREFKTEDGRVSDPERIKEIIFRGGGEPSLRAELWKYLLNYDMWEHSKIERDERRKDLEEEYYRMKLQWTTMSKNQEKNHSGYRDRKCQIEKDVKRTDRNLDFYNGDDNPNIERLQAILLTYVMYNFDIGYVQGMSDLLSPILYLIDDEAASFWCFVGFMEKVFRNFDEDQAGMKNQLSKLRTLMEFANPKLFKYLKTHDSDNMYFCFRWLLVWFKREFSHDDILKLWEVLWTSMPCMNFHMFIGLAILDSEMKTIIENEYGFTEILKHVNDLSEKMNLQHILEVAEAIYYQVINSSKLVDRVRIIVGLDPINTYGDDPYNSDDEEEAQIKREQEMKLKVEIDHSRFVEETCDNALDQNYF